MLRTRLWMGCLLVLGAVGVLVLDAWLAPWYPLLLIIAVVAASIACHELVRLLPVPGPRAWLCQVGVISLVLANWPAHVGAEYAWDLGTPWQWIIAVVVGFLLLVFLVEGASFRAPGGSVIRLAQAFWVMGYVGLLACCCVQTRWLPGAHGPLALAMTIFVPKSGDIGAYFTGRLLGRRRMAPVLSPKKTWEGAVGGLAASVIVAVGINAIGLSTSQGLLLSWPIAIGFGLTVGALGQLGDLMESMIKRDCERKDASAVVPGFGGVLDVLDSILFSAPVSYLWLTFAAVSAPLRET